MQPVDWHVLATVTAIYVAGLFSPGPNLLMVSQSAIRHGVRTGLATAAGVVMINAFWCSASFFGLGILLATMPWAMNGLRALGAAYLAWVAFCLWRDADKPVSAAKDTTGGGFQTGLTTNLGNVKAMVFYAAVFSASAPAGTTTITLVAALAVVIVASSLFYGAVVFAFSRSLAAAAYVRAKPAIDRVCSVMMLGFSIFMIAG